MSFGKIEVDGNEVMREHMLGGENCIWQYEVGSGNDQSRSAIDSNLFSYDRPIGQD
jgi:hypothetical protein